MDYIKNHTEFVFDLYLYAIYTSPLMVYAS
jgi:hypothetical protein